MADNLLQRHRMVKIPDSCGCTLTAASIEGLTPDRFAEMGHREFALARVISQSIEARTIGVTPSSLQDLLMSRIRTINKGELQKRTVEKQSIVMPFTYRNRMTNISFDYFKILSGAANPDAGTGDVPAHAWDIVVGTTDAWMSRDLEGLEQFFLKGQYIYVQNSDHTAGAGSQTAFTGAFKVYAAESVSGEPAQARVTIIPSFTAAGFAALAAPEQALHQPTDGVLEVGTNNVDDFESWCHNELAENTRSLITDWHQTSRYSQCHNDEYDRILKEINAGKVNEYLNDFRKLPLARQNAMRRKKYDDKWMRSVFYNQRINENQDPNTYDQLETIQDPDDGCVYGYKANALGLRTLLADENRILDVGGGTLDLDLLFQNMWEIKREREIDGPEVDTIDIMTDKDTAAKIGSLLIDYLKKAYGTDSITRFMEPGTVVDHWGAIHWKYNRYDIPHMGFRIAIFQHNFFTDRIIQFPSEMTARGRQIWIIDWTDWDIGLLGTSSVNREYRGKAFTEVNELFSCVITPNTKHYELRSMTWNNRIGNARRHRIIENFSDACPTISSFAGCTVPAE